MLNKISLFLSLSILSVVINAQVRTDTTFLKAAALIHHQEYDSAINILSNYSLANESQQTFFLDVLLDHDYTALAFETVKKYELEDDHLIMAEIYALNGNRELAYNALKEYLNTKQKIPEAKIRLNPHFTILQDKGYWDSLWLTNWYTSLERTQAEALYLIENEDYIAAIDSISYSLKENKNNDVLLWLRARAHYNMKNLDGARRDINKAIQQNHLEIDYFLLSAFINEQLFNYNDAAYAYQKYLQVKPQDFKYYINWAVNVAKTGDFKKAEAIFDQYEKYMGIDKDFLKVYAETALSSGNYIKALEKLNLYIETYGKQGTMLKMRGICYYQVGLYKYAERDLSFALDFFPHEADIFYFRGLTRLKLNINNACGDLWLAYELGNREAYNVYMKHCN